MQPKTRTVDAFGNRATCGKRFSGPARTITARRVVSSCAAAGSAIVRSDAARRSLAERRDIRDYPLSPLRSCQPAFSKFCRASSLAAPARSRVLCFAFNSLRLANSAAVLSQ